MHKEILNDRQTALLPLMAKFRREYYLVGGTAIALYIGHRRSADENFDDTFRMPSLLTLAAMKAYALGRRSKWKDYVDLYFLLKEHFSLPEIATKATEIFGELFSEKLFRAQLSYFDDVDYTEKVDYLISDPPSDADVKRYLTEVSLSGID